MRVPADAVANVINIRPMTAGDISTVLKMELEIFAEPFDRKTFKNIVAEDVSFAKWVVEVGGVIVAYAACSLGMDEADLITIAVQKTSQRKGVGTALFERILDDLVSRGVIRLFLEVRPSNESAKSFYFLHGFRQIGVRKNYYKNGEDALLLLKDL